MKHHENIWNALNLPETHYPFGSSKKESWKALETWKHFKVLAFRRADARLTLSYCAILGKSYSLLQCPCSCHFLCVLYCAVLESWKLKEYKNTQPLIGMPEPLPETGVLANHSSRKFERNEWKKERKRDKVSGFLLLDLIHFEPFWIILTHVQLTSTKFVHNCVSLTISDIWHM